MTIIQDFAGRAALVTGAASGIGAACARALAARGAAKLFLIDVDTAGLDALDLGACGNVADAVVDARDVNTWEAAAAAHAAKA